MSSSARTLEISTVQGQLCADLVSTSTRPSSGSVDHDTPEAFLAQPAVRLSAEVLSIKRVPAGSGVSYGHSYRTTAETTLILVSIGYGHGVPRKAGNRAQATWWDSSASQTIRLPIVGRVAMDVLVVDAGDTPVCAGDRVVLFGDPAVGEISLAEWSMSVAEDSVAIVCALDPRVHRVEHP